MPMFCVVYGCSNRSNREREKGFYRVPKIVVHKGEKWTNLTTKRRKKWISTICLQSGGAESPNVCSDHFVGGCPSPLADVESVDWAPTVNLGYQKTKPKSLPLQRGHTVKVKLNQPRRELEVEQPADTDGGSADIGCQTDLTMDDIKKMEDVLRDNQLVLIPRRQKLQLVTSRQYVTLQVPLRVTSQIHGNYG